MRRESEIISSSTVSPMGWVSGYWGARDRANEAEEAIRVACLVWRSSAAAMAWVVLVENSSRGLNGAMLGDGDGLARGREGLLA